MLPHVEEIRRALEAEGLDIVAIGLAWARTMPLIVLVPAFGLRALPGPARAVLALAFAMTLVPAAGLLPYRPREGAGWALLIAGELLHGLPVAIATAGPLWAATMAGDLVDALRGGQGGGGTSPVVEGQASTLGVPISMLASAIWLTTGGPARAIEALARPMAEHPVLEITQLLLSGIVLALSLAAPMIVTGILLEIALALITRAAAPAQITALLAPLRSIAILAALALVMDRVARVIAGNLH